MTPLTHCPNCNTKLSGLLTNLKILNEAQALVINEYSNTTKVYCSKCGRESFLENYDKWMAEVKDLRIQLKENIDLIKILTLQKVDEWEIEALGLITAQTVLGTGIITEVFSSFDDLLGRKSEKQTAKLIQGENDCKNQLRMKALSLRSNAILATDIDYSELGASKGMIMVSMSGTAVRVKNTNLLENQDELLKLQIAYDRLQYLTQYSTPENLEKYAI